MRLICALISMTTKSPISSVVWSVIMCEILMMEYKQLLEALSNKLSNDLDSYNSPSQYWM